MKFLCTILILIVLFSSEKVIAQNYFYVKGDISVYEKNNIKSQLEYIVALFDMQKVTIAVFKSELPGNYNATIKYEPNQQDDRTMILIRLNKRLAEEDYILTLSHEMIHVYQYYSGDLIRHGRQNFTWKGTYYKNILKLPHAKRPWEIEAIDQSKALTISPDFDSKSTDFL